ncbi:hypothetical protein E2562_035182 [Oryza meyeriana var. granulata]|uniref:Uncharacterized protein n=1 Tax=Oryza meyeriana var. granulata TaxID=110450 RepID=A0A6G1CCC0_9ORYZ|nr:hypothetical protein E2562_035182 [Oryza meyeriana var. granulata]
MEQRICHTSLRCCRRNFCCHRRCIHGHGLRAQGRARPLRWPEARKLPPSSLKKRDKNREQTEANARKTYTAFGCLNSQPELGIWKSATTGPVVGFLFFGDSPCLLGHLELDPVSGLAPLLEEGPRGSVGHGGGEDRGGKARGAVSPSLS